MKKKQCRVHYRKLSRPADESFPKQALSVKIREALEKKDESGSPIGEDPNNLVAHVPRNPDFRRVIGFYEMQDNWVFGNLCLFAPGQMQALLKFAEQQHKTTLAEALQISEQEAPDGHEYIGGIAYWLAIDDHFYLIQSQSVQTPAIEEYFNWLLKERSLVLDDHHAVILEIQFDRSQTGDNLDDIQSIQVGGIIPESSAKPVTDGHQKADVTIDSVEHQRLGDRLSAGWGKARKIMIELLGEVSAERLLKQLPDEAALEVKVDIGYRARKRKINKEFMSDIVSGLRNAPEGELKVVGKGGVIKGDDVRLSLQIPVKHMSDNSSLLDLSDAAEQMHEVHRRFVHDGRIL